MTTHTNSFGKGVAHGLGIILPGIVFGAGYLALRFFDQRVQGVVQEMFEPAQGRTIQQEYDGEDEQGDLHTTGFHHPTSED